MNLPKHSAQLCGFLIPAFAVVLLTGCQSAQKQSGQMTPANEPTAPVMATGGPTPMPKVIRIDAGSEEPYTDSQGNLWLADQGFADGEVVDRGDDVQITKTRDPAIYRTEHYDMTSFSQDVPNGKYTVKMHFAETYEEITGPGQRVFSFNVGGHEYKDFDVYAKADGAQIAYVETVDSVNVTNGKLVITFTANVQSPEINGIEIIPAP